MSSHIIMGQNCLFLFFLRINSLFLSTIKFFSRIEKMEGPKLLQDSEETDEDWPADIRHNRCAAHTPSRYWSDLWFLAHFGSSAFSSCKFHFSSISSISRIFHLLTLERRNLLKGGLSGFGQWLTRKNG